MPGPTKRPRTRRRQAATSTQVRAWQDDPDSGLMPISTATPSLGTDPLAVNIDGPSVAPGSYPTGTDDFRYWTAAEALTRAAAFWAGILPSGTTWEPGRELVATLDAGEDLNAYYDRKGLSFFHKRVGRRTIHSGESPDIVCHELGHAVLDSIKPELWDAASDEIAAFHEGFADCSAILSALQLVTVRDSVLEETEGSLYRTSRVSRLAEQLGAAIRRSRPDLVDPDCLRNAVNSFVYHVPEQLPHLGPAWTLSSEPHSFSRVWSGGFLEALAKMLEVSGPDPSGDALLTTARDAARLLVAGVIGAAVVPDFYSQVAAHMIAADRTLFRSKYRDALKSAFVRRGIVSLDSLPLLGSRVPRKAPGSGSPLGDDAGAREPAPTVVAIQAAIYGLGKQSLYVQAPQGPKVLEVRAAAFDVGSVATPAAGDAARSFVEDLFKRGRIDIGNYGNHEVRVVHPGVRKTHDLSDQEGSLTLERRAFDCGFGPD